MMKARQQEPTQKKKNDGTGKTRRIADWAGIEHTWGNRTQVWPKNCTNTAPTAALVVRASLHEATQDGSYSTSSAEALQQQQLKRMQK